MENVESAEEFEEKLTEAFEEFMKHNVSFNVQGSWVGEDGVEISVLVDYGVEDRDGEYYVGSVSARKSSNPDLTLEEYRESDTVLEAENALTSAIHNVFEVPYRDLRGERLESDIDFNSHYTILHGVWDCKVDKEQLDV